MPYDIGDSVPIAVDVKDTSGNLTNASAVTLTITLPDGTTTSPVVTNPPAVMGEYRYTYVPTVQGRHVWNVVTTTPNTAYGDVFEVRETPSPAIISLADAKAHLNIPATSTSFDEELREYLEAVTSIVESYVGPIVTRSYTRRINMRYRRYVQLPHTNVTAITGLTLVSDGSTPIVLSDLTVDYTTGIVSFKTVGGIFPYNDMDITYTVGRTYVKPNWTLAAQMILDHLWETQLGNLPSVQGDDQGYVPTGSGYLVPYRAIGLLDPDTVGGFA